MLKSTFDEVKNSEHYKKLAEFVGQQVRTARERKGWTQYDLAEYADVHQSTVANIERGSRVPSLDVTVRLFSALDRKFMRVDFTKRDSK